MKLYAIVEIPGKGKGMVAATRILVGKRILRDAPAVTLFPGESVFTKTFSTSALDLANIYPEIPQEFGIYKTNAIQRYQGSNISDLCVRISRCNHSCRPNAVYSWCNELNEKVLHAIRPIEKDEEITVQYKNPSRDFDSDMKVLDETFQFRCACSICSNVTPEYKKKYKQYLQLVDSILQYPRDVKKGFIYCMESISLIQELGFGVTELQLRLYDLFQIYVSVRDVKNAKVAVKAVLEINKIQFGDNGCDEENYKLYLVDPSKHPLFGVCDSARVVLDSISDAFCEEIVGKCCVA
ncbi:UNVERIFIED_CONTAM: hypothetical protein HDU68_000187 [Siphonaria sp. JEL0065]|nr:hypothetical protein HDU68_000187 [Siphonaria sp. JEL0065]